MITKEDLIQLHKKAKEDYSGCSSMFLDDGNFNKFNWDGGDGIIRQLEWKLAYNETYARDFVLDIDDHEYSGELSITKHYFSDRDYIKICVKYAEQIDTYDILYHEDCPNTELVNKNGRPINFDEYVRLLQIIEATGYKFIY